MFKALFYKVRDSLAARVNDRLAYTHRAEALTRAALTSQEDGIVRFPDFDEEELVVSLTTHGRRLHEVHLAIESVMQGSLRPHRIVLWLSDTLQDEPLPLTLQRQQERGLQVRYVPDLGPYTKLIPALEAYPNAAIVTIDDDIIYPYDTLELLVNAHLRHPGHICANRIIRARYDKKGRLASFPTWQSSTDPLPSPLNFFEGLGGVLYPAGSFTDEVFKSDIYRRLCPTADDIWFNVMAHLASTPSVCANSHYLSFPLLVNESMQDIALWRINNDARTDAHNRQLRAVLEEYGLNNAFL